MGANFSTRTFKHSDGKPKIEKRWASCVEASQYEDGHCYSGEIGMLGTRICSWHDLRLKKTSKKSAEWVASDWLSEKHQKWDGAMAVSFVHQGKRYWLVGGWCSS